MSISCPRLDGPDALWLYCPSIGAAILFSILFGVTTSLHIFQAILYGKRFCWVVTMGALWETLGFIFRCLAITIPTSEGVYFPQMLLVLLSPLWINAFVYLLLGRMVYFYLPDQSIFGIKAQRLGLLFVGLDVTSFAVQAVGGILTTGGSGLSDNLDTGLRIYTAGVALQAVFILFFLFFAVSFHRRVKKESTRTLHPHTFKLLYLVYASLGLIMFRIIFRIIEFSAGAYSKISSVTQENEFFPYVFDSAPMFIALILFNILHPGKILVGPESEFPKKTKAEKKSHKEEKKRMKQLRRNAEESGIELI